MCLVAYTPAAFNAAVANAERVASQSTLFGAPASSAEPLVRTVRNRVCEMLEQPVMRMVEYAIPESDPNVSRFAEIEDEMYERWDGMS